MPKDFNATEYRKFTDVISDSTLQLKCKKLPLREQAGWLV